MSNAVLVSGAGGFVGSAVVRLLVKSLKTDPPRFSDGTAVQSVIALIRPGSSCERLDELPKSDLWSIAYVDLANCSDLRALLRKIRPRVILHLAADRRIFQELSESERYRLHIAPLEALFESLAGVAQARFVNTSSAWLLPAGERLDETATPNPRVAYAHAKLEAEHRLPVMFQKTGVPWINLRLFNIFGRYEPASRLLPYLVSRLSHGQEAEVSSGDQVRDFTEVDNIAEAYLSALRATPEADCGVYHIGSGCGITVNRFATTVAEITGNTHLLRFGIRGAADDYLPCQVADPSLARRVLDWTPRQDVEPRIRKTVRWWLERFGIIPQASSEERESSL